MLGVPPPVVYNGRKWRFSNSIHENISQTVSDTALIDVLFNVLYVHLQTCSRFLSPYGLHTRIAAARVPLRQLRFLVIIYY